MHKKSLMERRHGNDAPVNTNYIPRIQVRNSATELLLHVLGLRGLKFLNKVPE